MITRLLTSRLLPSRVLEAPAPTAPRASAPYLALGRPGRPARVPTLLITIFDNSGSVVSPTGTDPVSNRFAEVDQAFSAVAKKGAPHELGAVLHFDVPSSAEAGPLPITRAGLPQLRSGLRVPQDGAGSSRLGPSLGRAGQLAKRHPDHEAMLVVLSDFLLLDPNPSHVLAELAAFPGTVHAVVLGGRTDVRLPSPIITTIIRTTDAPGAVAKAVFASLTRLRPGSRAFRTANTNVPSPQSR